MPTGKKRFKLLKSFTLWPKISKVKSCFAPRCTVSRTEKPTGQGLGLVKIKVKTRPKYLLDLGPSFLWLIF